jgi:hypothetical protein
MGEERPAKKTELSLYSSMALGLSIIGIPPSTTILDPVMMAPAISLDRITELVGSPLAGLRHVLRGFACNEICQYAACPQRGGVTWEDCGPK